MARRPKRSAAPTIPEGEDLDPHADDYQVKKVLREVEATKDLLEWMRNKGFASQVIEVGGVRLTAVVDLYPKKSVADLMGAASARGRRPDVDEFATEEERHILYGEDGDD